MKRPAPAIEVGDWVEIQMADCWRLFQVTCSISGRQYGRWHDDPRDLVPLASAAWRKAQRPDGQVSAKSTALDEMDPLLRR